MALKRIYKKRFRGVTVKSGHIYKFKYQAFENDPQPLVIIMYAIQGKHPNTGHEWRLFQAINFSYIRRSDRKRFAKDWLKILNKTQDPKFRWELVKSKYPYLKNATRRYFYKPNYYISKLEEIPFEDIEKEVISTFSKDFSKKVRSFLRSKVRSIRKRRSIFRRTGKFPRRK